MKRLLPIFPKESVKALEDMMNRSSKEEQDLMKYMGADMYSKGLLKGSLVTFGCASIPVIVYGLNRLLREHP